MRVVSIDNLIPGLCVGRPVVDAEGRTLLNSDVILTEEYIRALRAKGFARIYVKDLDVDEEIIPDEDLDCGTRIEARLALRDTMDAIRFELGGVRQESFAAVQKACSSDAIGALMGDRSPMARVRKIVNQILEEILVLSTLAGLTSIKSADSQLYDHSIDVCVVAIMIGQAIGFPYARLKQLATGCLLHDIGKPFMDGSADAVSQVRQHTLLGYEVLKNTDDPDIMAPHVSLEHHERQDGSGEPRGLVGSNTIQRDRTLPPPVPALMGEIAAVADTYDNLLSGWASQPAMSPDATIQALRSMAGPHLNKAVVMSFLRVVPVYPLGTEVLVRSDEYRNFTGLVSRVNPNALDRPVIILIRDNHGEPISSIELDLTAHPDIEVRCKGV